MEPAKRSVLELLSCKLTPSNDQQLQQEMSSSVLFGDVLVRKRIFWTIEEHLYFVYYPIIYYRRIKVYRFEKMDTGRYH